MSHHEVYYLIKKLLFPLKHCKLMDLDKNEYSPANF